MTIKVIHREFTEQAMLKYEGQPGVAEILKKIREEGYYDRGVSVYVNETSTGRDYLRFDCFEREPHYHYHHLHELRDAGVEISMEYLRISGYAECVTMNGMWHQLPFDSVANGDIRDWVLDRLGRRIAPMLREAGAAALADAVDQDVVARALAEAEPYVYATAPSAGRD
ncbi:DUF7700 domain-containing protein [Nocardioides humi]|uniref:DUF7700 domain-containing protein n=1 Tax=Nocardioides humi TaxID=449461 RepID=UPI00112D96C9|nr:hypothetical protein [Nocardioides humi]